MRHFDYYDLTDLERRKARRRIREYRRVHPTISDERAFHVAYAACLLDRDTPGGG